MRIEDIYSSWKTDSRIDDLNLDLEATKVPNLHSKYVVILSQERSVLRGLLLQKKALASTLREYYAGHMDQEALDKLGRNQCFIKILRADLSSYVDADHDMRALEAKIQVAEEKVELLLEIMKSINSRNYSIRAHIDYRRLTLGA
jgi:hypothetical protein